MTDAKKLAAEYSGSERTDHYLNNNLDYQAFLAGFTAALESAEVRGMREALDVDTGRTINEDNAAELLWRQSLVQKSALTAFDRLCKAVGEG